MNIFTFTVGDLLNEIEMIESVIRHQFVLGIQDDRKYFAQLKSVTVPVTFEV